MQLRIVSHAGSWSAEELARPGITLPGSVPALRALTEDRVPFVTTAAFYTPQDYRATWEVAFRSVWRLIRTFEDEGGSGPNVTAVYGYSLYLLVCEMSLLLKALDRVAERYHVTSVVVEDVDAQDQDHGLFYGALYSRYFHDVASAWATARGLSLVAKPVVRSRERAVSAMWTRSGLNAFELVRILPHRVTARLSEIKAGWNARHFLRDPAGRHPDWTLFYVPSEACGLGREAPDYAVNVEPLLRKFASPAGGVRPAPPPPVVAEALRPHLQNLADLVEQRWKRYVARSMSAGLHVYERFNDLLDHFTATNRHAALVMAVPFKDWDLHGYMAEAFRQRGFPVAGVQHGGNARLLRQGGSPMAITDFFGGYFFQWGPAADVDEFSTYGIDHSFTSVATGWVRMGELMQRTRRRSPRRTRKRLLYIPTLLNVVTITGINVPWEPYYEVIRSVSALLNRSDWECWVKVLERREAAYIGLEEFTNLRLIRRGAAFEYFADVDVILVDSLIASPFSEALATDKPLLLYTAAENQEWDPRFLELVRRRALCFANLEEYLQGLETFLANPVETMQAAAVHVDDQLLQAYYPPTTRAKLWSDIYQTFRTDHRALSIPAQSAVATRVSISNIR